MSTVNHTINELFRNHFRYYNVKMYPYSHRSFSHDLECIHYGCVKTILRVLTEMSTVLMLCLSTTALTNWLVLEYVVIIPEMLEQFVVNVVSGKLIKQTMYFKPELSIGFNYVARENLMYVFVHLPLALVLSQHKANCRNIYCQFGSIEWNPGTATGSCGYSLDSNKSMC